MILERFDADEIRAAQAAEHVRRGCSARQALAGGPDPGRRIETSLGERAELTLLSQVVGARRIVNGPREHLHDLDQPARGEAREVHR